MRSVQKLGNPDIPIASRFPVLKGNVHTAEVCAVVNVVKSRGHSTEHDLGTAEYRLKLAAARRIPFRPTRTICPYCSHAFLRCVNPTSQGLRRTDKVPSVPQKLLAVNMLVKHCVMIRTSQYPKKSHRRSRTHTRSDVDKSGKTLRAKQ